jgi:hypothetical protein
MEADILLHKFQKLPKSARKELMDFLDFLSIRYEKEKKKENENFSFDWEGGLNEIDETSVELQHKANQWR